MIGLAAIRGCRRDRVAAMRKSAGISRPPCTEAWAATNRQPESATQSTDAVERLLATLPRRELSACLRRVSHRGRQVGELRAALRIKHRPTFRANYLHPALEGGLIEHTIPDKPNSRLQKYRLTEAARRELPRERTSSKPRMRP